jgi:hypothetical protein
LKILLFFLAIGALLVVPPARADIAINSTNANAFATADGVAGPFDNHSGNNANPNVAANSVANQSFFGNSAHNDTHASFSATVPNANSANLQAHLSTSGNSFGSDSASGNGNVTATFTLTNDYFYNAHADGFANSTAAAGFFSSATSDANASGNFPGIGADARSSSGNNPFGSSFNDNASGILHAGTYTLSANVNTFQSTSGSASATGFADVNFNLDLVLVPEPSTLGLLGVGVLSLAGYGWMRRRKQVAAV